MVGFPVLQQSRESIVSTQGSAAAVLHRASLLYAENLLNRYVLFIGEHGEPVETFYSANSFRHLCGYRYKDHISAKQFFDRAVANTLSDKLLEPIYANNTRAKLRILLTVMCIDTRASFLIQNPALPGKTKADVVCGHVDAIIWLSGYRRMYGSVHCVTNKWHGCRQGTYYRNSQNRAKRDRICDSL